MPHFSTGSLDFIIQFSFLVEPVFQLPLQRITHVIIFQLPLQRIPHVIITLWQVQTIGRVFHFCPQLTLEFFAYLEGGMTFDTGKSYLLSPRHKFWFIQELSIVPTLHWWWDVHDATRYAKLIWNSRKRSWILARWESSFGLDRCNFLFLSS